MLVRLFCSNDLRSRQGMFEYSARLVELLRANDQLTPRAVEIILQWWWGYSARAVSVLLKAGEIILSDYPSSVISSLYKAVEIICNVGKIIVQEWSVSSAKEVIIFCTVVGL
jgi:hypothetical protein